MNLLPFGQNVKITHKFMEYETGWVTNVAKSFFNGHNWQYEIRTDKRLHSKYFNWGGEWFDEMDIQAIDSNVPVSKYLNIKEPTEWPPKGEVQLIKKPGIWVANGHPGNTIEKMYSWKPGSITCFYDYLQTNQVLKYKADNPNVPIIVRIQHPMNWQQNPTESARNLANEVISKWQDMKVLNPYVYFCNEMNLHYENGDTNPANQYLYETKEFYQKYADWVRMTADGIKQQIPEMKLITPPFAFGHNEDGVDKDNKAVPIDEILWAGYDYLAEIIKDYFDNILTFHAYWGDGAGSIKERLDDKALSSWYAFRWRRVLELFEKRYGMNCKMIIDEAGNFAVKDKDFTEQLLYFANETLSDDRVLALTYFLWLDPTKSPGNILNSWVDNLSETQLKNHLDILKKYQVGDGAIVDPEPIPAPIPEPIPDPVPEPIPEPEPEGLTLEITYERKGLPLIVGNYVASNVPILVQPPYGNSYIVISGSKSEYGKCGFEAGYANMLGNYLLTIEGVKYKVYSNGDGNMIKIKFVDNTEPEEMVVLKSGQITKTKANEIMNMYPEIFTIDKSLLDTLKGLLYVN